MASLPTPPALSTPPMAAASPSLPSHHHHISPPPSTAVPLPTLSHPAFMSSSTLHAKRNLPLHMHMRGAHLGFPQHFIHSSLCLISGVGHPNPHRRHRRRSGGTNAARQLWRGRAARRRGGPWIDHERWQPLSAECVAIRTPPSPRMVWGLVVTLARGRGGTKHPGSGAVVLREIV